MNTILTRFASNEQSLINVIDTCLSQRECKSLAGTFFIDPMVTSASVINHEGEEILLLEKDPKTLKCTKRIIK
jgi:hypothetical protein